MATKMWTPAYMGAASEVGELGFVIEGANASPAGGDLRFAIPGTGFVLVDPTSEALNAWDIHVGVGPTISFKSHGQPRTFQPTSGPAEFHFVLAATAVNPVTTKPEPVRLKASRQGHVLTATDPATNAKDSLVEMPGFSIDIYLEA